MLTPLSLVLFFVSIETPTAATKSTRRPSQLPILNHSLSLGVQLLRFLDVYNRLPCSRFHGHQRKLTRASKHQIETPPCGEEKGLARSLASSRSPRAYSAFTASTYSSITFYSGKGSSRYPFRKDFGLAHPFLEAHLSSSSSFLSSLKPPPPFVFFSMSAICAAVLPFVLLLSILTGL